MRKFAVSYINFFDNELKTKIISYPTNNWFECLIKAFPELEDYHFPEDIDEAKENANNWDFMFEVVEIKED